MGVSANVIGVDFTEVGTTKRFALGTQLFGDDGNTYTYVQAGGTIAASQSDISVNASFSATDGAGSYSGPAAGASANDYLWVYKAT